MFEGFRAERIVTDEAEIAVLVGGSGPPLLLLHGFPETHAMWHAVAPRLARTFSLVVPDLRGYGDSKGPSPDRDHRNYSKRIMAGDMITVMFALGYPRFSVAGHDRGARVAYRLALDRPDLVERLAVLDIVPTFEVWTRMDWRRALSGYHWLLLAQPAPLPERLIARDPDLFISSLLHRWAGNVDALHPEAVAAYVRQFQQPSVVEAACEDYRAGATIDFEHDRTDREAGHRLTRPVLLIWGRQYLRAKADATPMDIWTAWAEDVHEVALTCGHFVAEEQPDACAEALRAFFGG